MPDLIPYSALSDAELVEVYNRLARERGREPLKHWNDSRVKLVQAVALLRATPIPRALEPEPEPEPKRRCTRGGPTPLNLAIATALCEPAYYRTRESARLVPAAQILEPGPDLIPVGYSYLQIVDLIRKRTGETITRALVHSIATRVRDAVSGYDHFKLPPYRVRTPNHAKHFRHRRTPRRVSAPGC